MIKKNTRIQFSGASFNQLQKQARVGFLPLACMNGYAPPIQACALLDKTIRRPAM